MNLDTRARRAADGVHASTRRVDPMAQITELRHEEKTRRRNAKTVAIVGAAVALAGASWFAVTQLRGSDEAAPSDTVSTPSAPPIVNLEPGPTVGTKMTPTLEATAPKSWAVFKDSAYVNLGSDGPVATKFIEMDGPVLQVWDSQQNSGTAIPSGGYANWLRTNRGLTVLDDRMVSIDGHQFPQLTIRVTSDRDAVPDGYGVRLGHYADDSGTGWQGFVKGTLVTQTVIDVNGKTMVVSAYGAFGDAEQAEMKAALDMVLSSMKLPN